MSDNILNHFMRPFLYCEKILTVIRKIPFIDSDKKALRVKFGRTWRRFDILQSVIPF